MDVRSVVVFNSALSGYKFVGALYNMYMEFTCKLASSLVIESFQSHVAILPVVSLINIKTAGCCEFWLHDIDLVKYKANQSPNQTSLNTESHSPHTYAPPSLILPEIYKSHMACIYNTQGKCIGMISPIHFQILYRAFYNAKLAGLHEAITPARTSFAPELQGLLARKTKQENK
eukprot:1161498-Pelagomonas_calceolata.AAC.3